MHYKLIIKGIRAIIPGGISDLDFSTASEIDELSAKELLHIFLQNGIGILDGNIVNFQKCVEIIDLLLKIDQSDSVMGLDHYPTISSRENMIYEGI